tara:strand:+ start:194 stop:748 length:555 start_codon:yes stop_codon:yes gene_type:complete
MSTLKTGALRGTSGTADSIQLHASNQSVTFPGDVTCSGTATGFGGGKVVKHAFVSYDTQTDTDSTSYVDTGLSISYTPAAANNIVYALASQQCYMASGNASGDARARWELDAGGTRLQETQFESSSSDSKSEIVGTQILLGKFTAANTNAITIKTRYKRVSTNANAYSQHNGRASTLLIVEMEP